ncbi:methyl-accepting chemotaxis protein, partial [Pseudoduganella lurida]
MNLNRFKVQTRLAIGFALVLILLACSLGMAIRALGTLSESTDDIVTENYAEVLKAQELLNTNNVIARALRNAILVKTEAQAATELERVVANRKNATDILASLDRSIDDAPGRALYDTMKAARGPFGEGVDEFIRLRKEGQRDEAVDFMLTVLRERQNTYIHAIEALIKHESELMEQARLDAKATYLSGRNTALTMGALSLALGILAAALISRQLMRELGGEPADVAAIAGKIAAGDLAAPIDLRAGDKTSLLFAIRAMRDSL